MSTKTKKKHDPTLPDMPPNILGGENPRGEVAGCPGLPCVGRVTGPPRK